MPSFYFPFVVTVGGMLLYHLAQKSIPRDMNPFHATAIAYAVGILVCSVCGFAYTTDKSVTHSLKLTNWAVLAMGIGAAAIEVGFMLAYRVGWRISTTAVATNVAETAILNPIGLLLFREHISPRNFLGVMLCLIGLVLVLRD